ncbi:MAG TPA: aminotransferase class I/II-fold pyridoxal phosphate-dependent enzyme, partial [Rhizomicrobium sp.]|nr:aminotransferase class I/II-fold pyridoxal phosphate-dependent enzyme [Rhizomicrobium sp.]
MLLSQLPPGPFVRLAKLLGEEKPGKAPISLAVGDPSGKVPDFIMDALSRHSASFGNYPAVNASEDWRQAAGQWLNSRFGLGGQLNHERHVLPLNGTREGLFSVLFPLMPLSKAGGKPIVAMPNPFYQCYAAAALCAGAEPLYVPATEATGFLPDYASLLRETLDRIVAVYICSPSNPEGAVAGESYWNALF